MIPELDQRGLLPEGVHTTPDWQAIAAAFAGNDIRRHRLNEMHRFITQELQAVAAGLELFVGGSYFSDKPSPGDIDCTIFLPLAEIPQRKPFFQLCNDGGKGRIWHDYGVELYPSIEHIGTNDFRLFFQYVGEKTATLKALNEKDKRGIIKVEKWILG